MKQFLSVSDVPDAFQLVKEGLMLKKNPFQFSELGKNKTLGLIFLNPSLRTRMSTHKAALNLGMSVMVMNLDKEGWQIEMEDGTVMDGGSQEHIKEAVGVISRYCDILGVRTFAGLQDREKDYAEEVLMKFVKYSSIPVVSLESATRHPFQSLADWMTIEEHKKTSHPKVVLTWAAHPKALPQAVPNSFVEWMKIAPVDLVVTHPEGYELADEFSHGVKVVYHQDEALKDADFVYAKNWSSYKYYGQIYNSDRSWMITPEKMALTNNAKFMHCLPVRRNVIVADAVIDSPNSIVLDEAENRVYSAQIVLKKILEGLK
ncbi:MAG: acetylornithine carbamoyltransferase [Flammeovirgaceae bacterium]